MSTGLRQKYIEDRIFDVDEGFIDKLQESFSMAQSIRLVKGEKLQRIADRYGLTVAFLRRNFNHYIKDSSTEKVKLGYKNEPYYKNEMDYGTMPSYNVSELSAPELKIYNEI